MAGVTTFDKHWAIGGVAGMQRINGEKDEIIFEALMEEIKKRVYKIYSESFLKVQVQKSEVIQDVGIEFVSPKFADDYSVFDSRKYFLEAQKWIGHVEQIKNKTFIAKLTDLTNTTTYEMGEFDFDEISPEDMELVKIGATFYWSLGRSNNNGQIEKKSILRFQRVKNWEEEDYDRVLDRAEEKMQKLEWK